MTVCTFMPIAAQSLSLAAHVKHNGSRFSETSARFQAKGKERFALCGSRLDAWACNRCFVPRGFTAS